MKRDLLENWKNQQLAKILETQKENITGIKDLIGDDEPSLLFYILADKLGYLLDENYEKTLSSKGIEIRRKLNFLIKLLGPAFLKNPQIIENRNLLLNPEQNIVKPDNGITLPEEPVIWAPNHAFKDDTLASILAAYRHSYILFGSLPQFYNTFDGITAYINGVNMSNRKVKNSKHSSVDKGIKTIEYGADLLIFPEGVWNKTPNQLLLDLWPGIYRISKETGSKVVPMAHYIRDCACPGRDNPIHTVIAEPIRIDDLSEKAGLNYLRDAIATWYYLMLERYGQSTREEELKSEEFGKFNDINEAWEYSLWKRVKTADRYDTEIEYCADYHPQDKVEPLDVWSEFADTTKLTENNISSVLYAKQLVKNLNQNNYQRRF